MRKIAVFGGSFDPPHLGHLKIIQTAFDFLEIENLFVVPTFLNPFKSYSLFSANKRLEWLEILTQDLPLPITLLDYEIRQNKPTPTFETINFISQTYNPQKIYLLIGADNLKSLSKWYCYENLKNKVEFVIIPRLDYQIDSSFKVLPMQPIHISSTHIREALQKQDLKTLEFVPKAIIQDILKEANCKKTDNKQSISSSKS